MMRTYAGALNLIGPAVPAHVDPQAPVPILCGPQAQGDLLVVPARPPPELAWRPLPSGGAILIAPEGDRVNAHRLHRGSSSPGVEWVPLAIAQVIAYLRIPTGQSALLLHSAEHAANGIGAGTYAVHRKLRLAGVDADRDDEGASEWALDD